MLRINWGGRRPRPPRLEEAAFWTHAFAVFAQTLVDPGAFIGRSVEQVFDPPPGGDAAGPLGIPFAEPQPTAEYREECIRGPRFGERRARDGRWRFSLNSLARLWEKP